MKAERTKQMQSSQKEAGVQVSMEKFCPWLRTAVGEAPACVGHCSRRCFLTELSWILVREKGVGLGLKEELFVEDD